MPNRLKAILRHHHAVFAIVIASPVKACEFEIEPRLSLGQRFEQFLAGWNNFFADTITGNAGDLIGGHERLSQKGFILALR